MMSRLTRRAKRGEEQPGIEKVGRVGSPLQMEAVEVRRRIWAEVW